MKPPRIAVIGAGNIFRSFHLPCLKKLGVVIDTVLDPDKQCLELIKSLVSPHTLLIQSKNIDLPRQVDAVLVSSPTAMHYDQVRLLLKSGINVLCEKPLSCFGDKAQELLLLASQQKIVLQVGYYRRFHPSLSALKHIMRSGKLGCVRACTVRAGHIFTNQSVSLVTRSLSGGGVLMDFGVHVVDYLYALFDDLRFNSYWDDNMGNIEANALLNLTGMVGLNQVPIVVKLSRTSDLGYSLDLEFDHYSVTKPLNTGHEFEINCLLDSSVMLGRLVQMAKYQVCPPYSTYYYFCQQWNEFFSRIHGDREVCSCLVDAVRTTELVDHCYANSQKLTLGWGL